MYDQSVSPRWGQETERLRVEHAVAIDTEHDEPVIGKPRYVFEGEYDKQRRGPSYSVAPDGRFLLVDRSCTVGRLEVILNWAEDLKRLVPTGR